MSVDSTPPLSKEQAEELLKRLSSDDEFRDLFKRAPSEALSAIGYKDSSALGSKLLVEELASKEEIAQAHDQIRDALSSSTNMQPVKLCASEPHPKFKK